MLDLYDPDSNVMMCMVSLNENNFGSVKLANKSFYTNLFISDKKYLHLNQFIPKGFAQKHELLMKAILSDDKMSKFSLSSFIKNNY